VKSVPASISERGEALCSRSAAETAAIGAALGRALPPLENAFAVLFLRGALGAGKTTLVRGLLQARGISDPVRSPTFTLLELYQAAGLTFVHIDLYRLGDPEDLVFLGVRDYARPGHVWLVEWPDRAAQRLPAPDLELTLEVHMDHHRILATAFTELGRSWLGQARGVESAPAHS
jgi:tRNA threonylcarbamoyladenosine biosynthesis protein TsaE